MKGGDNAMEFEEVYRKYFNDVYLYVRRLSGDEHIAEEITSDTFYKALYSINKFRGDCDIRVWLCQIAKTAISHTSRKEEILQILMMRKC